MTETQRLAEMERRIAKLEGGPALPRFDFSDDAAVCRVFGWGIGTAAALGVLLQPDGADGYLAGLVIGLLLIHRGSRFRLESDSARRMAGEARSGRAKAAGHAHLGVGTLAAQDSPQAAQLSMVAGFALLAGLGSYLAASRGSSPALALAPTAALIAALFAAAVQRRMPLLAALAAASLTACGLLLERPGYQIAAVGAAGLVAFSFLMLRRERVAASATAVAALILLLVPASHGARLGERAAFAGLIVATLLLAAAALPFIRGRRQTADGEWVRYPLLAAPIAYVAAISALGASGTAGAAAALTAVLTLYAGAAYAAWRSARRLSYAKYYLTAGALVAAIGAYLVLDGITVTLIWFMLGVAALTAGFTLPSLSARFFGLGLYASALIHYCLLVLPFRPYAAPLLLSERIWTGLLIGGFGLLVSAWYAKLPLRADEARLRPAVRAGLSASFFLIAAALFALEGPAGLSGTSWLLLGYLAYRTRATTGLAESGKAVGILLAALGAGQLLLFDLPSLPEKLQLLAVAAAAGLLVAAGLSARPRRASRLHRRHA